MPRSGVPLDRAGFLARKREARPSPETLPPGEGRRGTHARLRVGGEGRGITRPARSAQAAEEGRGNPSPPSSARPCVGEPAVPRTDTRPSRVAHQTGGVRLVRIPPDSDHRDSGDLRGQLSKAIRRQDERDAPTQSEGSRVLWSTAASRIETRRAETRLRGSGGNRVSGRNESLARRGRPVAELLKRATDRGSLSPWSGSLPRPPRAALWAVVG